MMGLDAIRKVSIETVTHKLGMDESQAREGQMLSARGK